VNTEERQLAEMLHRVTPEPPRRVTVEDVAFRVASEPRREPRSPRGSIWRNRGWTPVLAALSVFAIAGASAGIATVATSHHGRTQAPGDGTPTSTAQGPTSASASAPSTSAGARLRIAGGIWGAELINRQSFSQGSLISDGEFLYAAAGGNLDQIVPDIGNIGQTTPYNPPILSRPVVVGSAIWVVSSYSGGDIVLHGFVAHVLGQFASIPVPAIGGVSSQAAGVLAAGPDGKLYVAAGDTVATVDPATRQVTHRIYLTAGRASSVAVSPDGSKLYVGVGSFRLLVYDLATGREVASSRMSGSGGNLVATSGGVWGTTGSGMSQWVWFAPGGDLAKSFRVSQGAGGGLASLPVYSGGVVWVGGTHELVCASPATGHALARTPIPADHGVVEYFDSPTVLNGHVYALYQDERAQLAGVASLTPPAACSG
jgi:hypothetical protein